MLSSRLGPLALVFPALAATVVPARGAVLLTEVIPNVVTTSTRGDVVEIFNSGPGAVDLTGWVLSDLDSDPVAGVPEEATFAAPGLGLPPLAPGAYAVIDFVDVSGTASWRSTNYGLRVVAPLEAGSFLGSERDELVLLDADGTPLDAVAWSDGATTVPADSLEDLSALTGVLHGYGLVPGEAAWGGPEDIVDDAGYYFASVDFSAYATASTWGGGSIRRRSAGGVFDVGAPDGQAQWEAVPRWLASPGNPSDDVPTLGGLAPLRVTDDLAGWLGQAESTTFPDRRIAPLADQSPADFVPAGPADLAAWEGVLSLAMAGQWEQAFAAAAPLGFEVVEFLDTASGLQFHVLRERVVPGEAGFAGMGIFVFHDGPDVRGHVVLEVPHPIFDGETLEEGALAVAQVKPRVAMVAGTHRNNSTVDTTCDGTFDGGMPYRESDVAHHPANFFHAAHAWLHGNLPDMLAVQFHGFCCPGSGSYASLADDCVVSHGVEAPTSPDDFVQVLRARIDAQGHEAAPMDVTTAAVFGDDTDVLGATNNLQARVSNGVAPGDACTTAAGSASGRFAHLEQDSDVRADPQHVITALVEALDLVDADPPPSCPEVPEAGCRAALLSQLSISDSVDDTRDRLGWKWSKGGLTAVVDWADPVTGAASYLLCLYDASATPQPLLEAVVGAGGNCAGKPCWKAAGSGGFGYKDKAGASDGVTGMRLKAGAAGKAGARARGAGSLLGVPALPLVTPVVVQLLVDNGGAPACWESVFSAEPLDNSTARFRARQ